MKKKILFIFICISLFCTGCNNKLDNEKEINNEKDDIEQSTLSYSGRNGTADKIEGKTVIISIYVSDMDYKWNFNNDKDNDRVIETFNNLRIATDYLTKQVEKYDKKAEFIYDWYKDINLRYIANIDDSIVNNYNDKYIIQKEWIIDNIDIIKIKDKYMADNIIFMCFFNTDNSSNAITSTYNFDLDIVNIFPENDKYIIPPATYAHELLHTFGAPDLYFENAVINQEYVDYYMENYPSDIMASVYYGNEITNTFSELDAYYVGLIDSHPDIEKWGLGISDHIYND